MRTFKDAVSADVANVFLNMDEFADRHNLNGRDVICLVDTDMTDPAKERVNKSLEGVFVNSITVYVKPDDLERRPVERELLYLDGEMYFVQTVSSEMGLLVITAEVHGQ